LQAPFCRWERREAISRFYGQEENQKGIVLILKKLTNQLTNIDLQQICILAISLYRRVIATVRTLFICNIIIVTKLQPNDLIAWTSNQLLRVKIYTTLLCDVTLIFFFFWDSKLEVRRLFENQYSSWWPCFHESLLIIQVL
jgi:hypothetical protein